MFDTPLRDPSNTKTCVGWSVRMCPDPFEINAGSQIAEGGDPWNGNHWYHESCTGSAIVDHALERPFV